MTDETTPTHQNPPSSSTSAPPTGTPWRPLTSTHEVALPHLGSPQFLSIVFAQRVPHTAETRWDTTARSLDPVTPHALTTVRTTGSQSALLDLQPTFGPRSFALVTLQRRSLHVRMAAAERELIADIETWLRDLFPVLEPAELAELPVRFWSCGPRGANVATRMIDVPDFAEIEANYPLAVRERLRRLVDPGFRPAQGGQLILWYGPPGTGKTYALRALAWEWRRWCELHYVVDPDVFFGQRADYMIDVLLQHEEHSFLEDAEAPPTSNWRLLVLEDTGELLAADAKERTGQGLSRLLNLVDGIVGQGLRVLVLVTTNEPLRRLHPAVARPGRCAARIEFVPFSTDEAAAWLERRGGHHEGAGPATLADLFARLHGYELQPEQPVGFAR